MVLGCNSINKKQISLITIILAIILIPLTFSIDEVPEEIIDENSTIESDHSTNFSILPEDILIIAQDTLANLNTTNHTGTYSILRGEILTGNTTNQTTYLIKIAYKTSTFRNNKTGLLIENYQILASQDGKITYTDIPELIQKYQPNILLSMETTSSEKTLFTSVGPCSPSSCPDGYKDDGVSCSDGICTRTCSKSKCSDTFRTVYSYTENLIENDYDADGEHIVGIGMGMGSYTPIDSTKCYRFRQTTPSNFISSSDISGYDDLHNLDSAIGLYWTSYDSIWYDNQNNYCLGENSVFLGSNGGVWIDSCIDSGDDFDSADSLSNTNNLYCAPDAFACSLFNPNCDTECYGSLVSLRLSFNADVDQDYDCNSFYDFCNLGYSDDTGDPYIRWINFRSGKSISMFVDEYDLVSTEKIQTTCEYWPECNPIDPCCTTSGKFKSSGTVCKSAHNPTCNSASTSGCSGTAYEDRCTGTSSLCPDNNYAISYNKACDNLVCQSQSCSGNTLQPERICDSGACLRNDAYDCPANLKCSSGTECKSSALSSSDCKTSYSYDASTKLCWKSSTGFVHDIFYDSNGNMQSAFGLNFIYDKNNNMVSVQNSKNSSAFKDEYIYDHNGNRLKKIEYDSSGRKRTTYYVSQQFISVEQLGVTTNEKYHYLDGKLIAKEDYAGNMFYYENDMLGSPRIITNAAGKLLEKIEYAPFGGALNSSGQRFTFTGKELDESSLMYFGARYYEPNILRRFTQADNIIQNRYNPQNLNQYSYVINNPYRYIDPDGHFILPGSTEFIFRFPAPLENSFKFGPGVEFPSTGPYPLIYRPDSFTTRAEEGLSDWKWENFRGKDKWVRENENEIETWEEDYDPIQGPHINNRIYKKTDLEKRDIWTPNDGPKKNVEWKEGQDNHKKVDKQGQYKNPNDYREEKKSRTSFWSWLLPDSKNNYDEKKTY